MPLVKDQKGKLINQFQVHGTDTGSAPVQVALLTERINLLTDHFKIHRKDHHSRQGLLKLVSQRRKLLEYLKSTDRPEYKKVLDRLNLRK
ncbi:MAG: 30S ribosomal protein S15 [Candidatus Omnitrophica bacterium]|nr:30S ribosomal protein S15 [Candidatus Omnitrophota bacterium]